MSLIVCRSIVDIGATVSLWMFVSALPVDFR